jgi:fructose-bisphosphate aldolase, class I
MSEARLGRMFAADGKCFDVAIDHGFFGEASFLAGIEDMARAVRAVVEAGPDAVQLTVGQAPLLQEIPGKAKPALVLRTDVANVYGRELPRYLFSKVIAQAVEQALRLDAACLCVNLFMLPGEPEVHAQCVDNITRLKPEAERYGMPMMVEPLVMRTGVAGGYAVDGDVNKILPLVRQAVELGADVIKADPTDDLGEYHRVVEVAGRVPVLVRGGGRASDEEILGRTAQVMEQGARGIVYGRNVIQHEDPPAMTRALMSIVHQGATPEAAMKLLRGEP